MARLPGQVATRRAHFAHVLVADLPGARWRVPGFTDVPDACARDYDDPRVAGFTVVGGGFASPRGRFCGVLQCHDGQTFAMDLWADTTPCLKGMVFLPGCPSVATGQWPHRRRQSSSRRCFERRSTCYCKTDEAPLGDGAPARSTPPRGPSAKGWGPLACAGLRAQNSGPRRALWEAGPCLEAATALFHGSLRANRRHRASVADSSPPTAPCNARARTHSPARDSGLTRSARRTSCRE